MAKTTNYNWDLPSPSGMQIAETARIAGTIGSIDAQLKAFEDAYLAHRHAFADLTDRPDTLGGYGITDGMTAAEIAAAIKAAIDGVVNGSGAALDTLKELADALGNDPQFATTVSNALGARVRVDAAQSFSLAQKAQGRGNIDALGKQDRGAAGGVAPLGSDSKVPPAYLPSLTTTATVGAAMAGANSKATPADGDFFTGVEAGGSTMFKTTLANIRTALTSGAMAGRAFPRYQDGANIDHKWEFGAGQPTHLVAHFGGDKALTQVVDPLKLTVGHAKPLRSDGVGISINWYDPGGEESYLLGSSDGVNFRAIYRANMSVNYANSSNYANGAGNANTVGGWSIDTIQGQINAGVNGRIPYNAQDVPVGSPSLNGVKIHTYGWDSYSALQFRTNINGTDNIRGSISVRVTSGVTYGTASDYRLKPSVEPLVSFELADDQFAHLDNTLLRVLAWRPIRHNWVEAPDVFTHGFLAHELQAVSPHAVVGEKDAMQEIGTAVIDGGVSPDTTRIELREVEDEEGNISTVTEEIVVPGEPLPDTVIENVPQSQYPEAKSWTKTGERPEYQNVDHSKLVPELAAALQSLTLMVLEQRAQIDGLRSTITTS